MFGFFGLKKTQSLSQEPKILRRGVAKRVVFYCPGEEGTYIDHGYVTLYANGIVHIRTSQEETTTHIQNCEILWRVGVDEVSELTTQSSKIRFLRPSMTDW